MRCEDVRVCVCTCDVRVVCVRCEDVRVCLRDVRVCVCVCVCVCEDVKVEGVRCKDVRTDILGAQTVMKGVT